MKRIIALILSALMIIGVFTSCASNKNTEDNTKTEITINDANEGDNPSDVISFQSEHYKVDNNMLNYLYRFDYYESIERYYDSYFQYYNLDPTKDLKTQQCKLYESEEYTWFDYFISMTTSNIVNFLYFAERAYDEGNENAPEIAENVEKDLESLKSAAEYYGVTEEEFIKSRFGKTVTEEDVIKSLELYYTGTYQYDLDLASIKVSDDDMDNYFEEHKSDFIYCDFRSYQFKASDTSDTSTYKEAEKNAKELLATGNEDDFIEWIYNYEKKINNTLEEPLTEDEMRYYSRKITVEYSYNDTTEFGKWAFQDGRKVGDMTMLDNGQGTYTVYYIYTAPTRHDNHTANISRILIDVDDYDNDNDKIVAKAKELLAEFEKTDKSEESFNKLCEEYDSESTYKFDEVGTEDLETQLGAWCIDEERKEGDYELVPSQYGYYFVFYRGAGEIQWKKEAYEAIRQENISEIYSSYMDKYTVEINENNLKLVSGITSYTNSDTTAADTEN